MREEMRNKTTSHAPGLEHVETRLHMRMPCTLVVMHFADAPDGT